jgi:FkbM family methyltransferase
MLLSRFQKPVDTFVPSLGLLYRYLRDDILSRSARRTKYGFTLAGSWYFREDYEPDEAAAFLEMLENHEIVLDIGANVGFYSCLAASRGKQVICFEPSPRNLKYLYRNLWDNQFRNVEIFPLGLAKQPGLNRLYGFSMTASFVPGWRRADKGHFTTVPVTSLDTIMEGRFRNRKLLIKMDVEGFELDVLAGAERTLALTPKPTWMVEVFLAHETIPGGTNTRFAETFELFWKHGYQCEALNAKRGSVQPADVRRWAAKGVADAETSNFLFFDGGAPR